MWRSNIQASYTGSIREVHPMLKHGWMKRNPYLTGISYKTEGYCRRRRLCGKALLVKWRPLSTWRMTARHANQLYENLNEVCIKVKETAICKGIKSNTDSRRQTPKQSQLLECLARGSQPSFLRTVKQWTLGHVTKRLTASTSMNDLHKSTMKEIPHNYTREYSPLSFLWPF